MALLGLVAAFTTVYVTAYIGWGAYGITGKRRATLSSCVISIIHGLMTCVMAGQELASEYPIDLAARNNATTIFIMQISMAYMITDFFLFLIPFTPTDFLFIAHHVMTIGYMMSSSYLSRGGLSCLVLMVLGESTSLFQNSWLISRELRDKHPVAMSSFRILSPIYTYIFLFVRSVLAPPVIAWFCIRLLATSQLPYSYRSAWASLAAITTVGSQIWSYKLWQGLKKSMKK